MEKNGPYRITSTQFLFICSSRTAILLYGGRLSRQFPSREPCISRSFLVFISIYCSREQTLTRTLHGREYGILR